VTDRGTPPVGTPSRDPELKRSAVEQVFNPATGCEDTVEVGPVSLKPGAEPYPSNRSICSGAHGFAR